MPHMSFYGKRSTYCTAPTLFSQFVALASTMLSPTLSTATPQPPPPCQFDDLVWMSSLCGPPLTGETTHDLARLKSCCAGPVPWPNCAVLYRGSRNFYDAPSRLCIPTDDCATKTTDQSGKVILIYNPLTNTCNEPGIPADLPDNLSEKLSQKQETQPHHSYSGAELTHNKDQGGDKKPRGYLINENSTCECGEHGTIDPSFFGCFCRCDIGWTSPPPIAPDLSGDNDPDNWKWCNILQREKYTDVNPSSGGDGANPGTVVALFLITSLLLFCIWKCCWKRIPCLPQNGSECKEFWTRFSRSDKEESAMRRGTDAITNDLAPPQIQEQRESRGGGASQGVVEADGAVTINFEDRSELEAIMETIRRRKGFSMLDMLVHGGEL